MGLLIGASLRWIEPEYGGHMKPPVVGLRPTIRFQRDVASWLTVAWDVQLVSWEAHDSFWSGKAKLAFSSDAKPDKKYLEPGEPIELLDAFRVVAVGTIST
jgi:hypothetical protein